MGDQDLVLVVQVSVVVPAAVARMDVGEVIAAVHRMDEAEVVQIGGHLQGVPATLHRHEGAAVLQVMEDVVVEKVALPQAGEICIETIKEK